MANDSLSGRLRALPGGGALPLLALWLVSFAVVATMSLRVHEPIRFIDEFLFWALAKNYATGDGLSWRGWPVPLVSNLYPLLISPVFRVASGVQQQYELVRVLGAGLVTSVVFPIYLTARLHAGRGLALLAAALGVLCGAAGYAGLIATETLAYPLATAAFGALTYALLRPGLKATALFTAFFVLAAATRIQLTAIYAVALLALALLVAIGDEGGRRALLRRQRALATVLAVLGGLACAYLALRGRAALGIYGGGLIAADFNFGDLFYWLRAYTGEIFLISGVLPAVATLALAFDRERRREPAVLALLVVALAAAVVLVLQLSLFSAANTEFWRERNLLYERYMIYLGPLLFVGFVWALGRVGRRAVTIATAITVVVLAAFPRSAVKIPFSVDAFGQAFLGYLLDSQLWLSERLGLVLVLLALCSGGLLALASSGRAASYGRIATLLAVVVPVYLLTITQLKAWEYQEVFSAGVKDGYPKPVDWIERAGAPSFAILVGAGSEAIDSYGVEFRNPSAASVYVSELAPVASPPVHSPTCELKLRTDGKILGGEYFGCRTVPQSWLTIGSTFAMRLRGGVQLAPPSGDADVRLQTVTDTPRILAMVGGRERRSGRVDDLLVVRTFFDQSGAIRIRSRSGRLYTRRVGSGDQLTLIGADELGLGVRPRTGPLEVREGDGRWLEVE